MIATIAVVVIRASPDPEPWRRVAPGVMHRGVDLPSGIGAEVVRVDLTLARIQVVDARAGGGPRARARTLRDRTPGAVVAVNGGFFDENGAPMGLVLSGGRETNSLRRADWGVFWVAGEKAGVMHTTDWRDSPVTGASEGLQSGPRLVVDRRPVKLKPQVARRTVVCIRTPSEVLLVVTQGIDARALAEWLARSPSGGGLGCTDALNLDGGPSTQLSLQAGERTLEIEGRPVPNGLVVVPR